MRLYIHMHAGKIFLNESKIRHDHMILSFAYDAGKTAMLYSYSEYMNVVLVLKWSDMLLKFTAPAFIINNHLKRLDMRKHILLHFLSHSLLLSHTLFWLISILFFSFLLSFPAPSRHVVSPHSLSPPKPYTHLLSIHCQPLHAFFSLLPSPHLYSYALADVTCIYDQMQRPGGSGISSAGGHH